MILTPDGDGGYTATGGKYYIGNGNVAGLVSVFGRRADVEGPDGYVFFAADSRHEKFELVQNVVDSQMFVSEFELHAYPVTDADILHTGADAFSAALNTVNVGKFNLCTASVGIAEHSFYEAITHAHNRILYGHPVTDFGHVRASFVDAYARLVAMKLFSARAVDYFRTANPEDRRYLLFNPITKMKVTSEGERVVDLLWDVIAARGFEKDTYFNGATHYIRALPKLEGTVHVNLALVLKFMPNYLFSPQEYPEVPTRADAADDAFLFQQGPARGLGKVRFHDWRAAYRAGGRRAERRPLHRAGRGADAVPGDLPAGRGAAAGPGLPAEPRTPVHARRLRPAGAGAGAADRAGGRGRGPDLRLPGPRLLRVRRRAARQAVLDPGAAGVGARRGAQAGGGRRAVRPDLGPGGGFVRCLRDAPLKFTAGLHHPLMGDLFIVVGGNALANRLTVELTRL